MEIKFPEAQLTLNSTARLPYVHIVNASHLRRFKSMGSLRQSAIYDGNENLGFTSDFAPV
jgi:hypothetical protein